MPAGQFTPVRVALFPFAHMIRPGSRLRLNIEAPGGNQPFWKFADLDPQPGQVNEIAHSVGRPSRVVLPVLPSVLTPNVPATVPPCPALRNQPCRDYLPARVPTGVTASLDGVVDWTPPASGGQPDGYHITELGSGATWDVAGDVTTLTVPPLAAGQTYAYTVAAVYGETTAPASDASLSVTVAPPESTTTTAPASSSTSSTVAAPSSEPDQLASAPTTTSSTLPITGAEVGLLVGLGLALVAGGAFLVSRSRRRATS